MESLKRATDAIRTQERDLALLRGLFECRLMTARHVAALYFDGKAEATKKRLRKLKGAGLIGDRRRKAYEPSILFLTRKGLLLLRERGVLAEFPPVDLPVLDRRARVSDLTLRHELDIMDVKAAFHSAVGKSDVCTLERFSTWPLLYQFEAFRPGQGGAEVTVKPDGFVHIHEKEDGTKGFAREYFLEVDRSTETQETLIARAGCYHDYYKSGGFAEWRGGSRSEYREYPFRVLMVFKTAERRNNTAERLLQSAPLVPKLTWLSTIAEVLADPLGSIWIRPADYRQATTGTPFDPERAPRAAVHIRRPEREAFVEQRVRKCRLLATS